MSGTTFLPYKMKFGEIGFLKSFYLVEIDVDKLVEVGVETLDDVEADDEVDALQIEMIYYLVNISAGARPGDKRLGGAGGGGGGGLSKKQFSALRASVWSLFFFCGFCSLRFVLNTFFDIL